MGKRESGDFSPVKKMDTHAKKEYSQEDEESFDNNEEDNEEELRVSEHLTKQKA